MPFAQANSYVRSFGFWGGMLEMGKGFFDPFGFHEAVEPQEYGAMTRSPITPSPT